MVSIYLSLTIFFAQISKVLGDSNVFASAYNVSDDELAKELDELCDEDEYTINAPQVNTMAPPQLNNEKKHSNHKRTNSISSLGAMRIPLNNSHKDEEEDVDESEHASAFSRVGAASAVTG